jgi:hypothetical protein
MMALGLWFACGFAAPLHATDEMSPPGGKAGMAAKADPFSAAEVKRFLAAARRAEAIDDPLKRCIAYPNPPGSHWASATTRAYCVYRLQKIMAYDEVVRLIESGRADELDAYLAQVLDEQMTKPEAAGRLDRFYFAYFMDATEKNRALVDSWKRQSPTSAFAYAASGRLYVSAAGQARGTDVISKTPSDSLEEMERRLDWAAAELEKAASLNPRVTPVYPAMIDVARYRGDTAYARKAFTSSLEIQPSNYAVRAQMLIMAEPKWGGSLEEMNQIAQDAQAYTKENGLLPMLLPMAGIYDANLAANTGAALPDPAPYRKALDQVPMGGAFDDIAGAAEWRRWHGLAAVYRSEQLRFTPIEPARLRRIRDLIALDQRPWALEELKAVEPELVGDVPAQWALAADYRTLGDLARAEKIYLHAVDIGVSIHEVIQSRSELAYFYMDWRHDWDKAWDVANGLIKDYPSSPAGWLQRARIQKAQPRAGLQESIDILTSRFGTLPGMGAKIEQLKRSEDVGGQPVGGDRTRAQ